MRDIAITPAVQALLDQKAPVAVGVSGGKDSHALAGALSKFLEGYGGSKVLIHADLGSVEWGDSLPACRRIADRIGWELVTCSRKAGGMMQRWRSRWESSRRRYIDMETVAVVLPWSTPSMRFCTSELKVDPITSALKRRFGRVPIINATGVRGEESPSRAQQPVSAKAAKLPEGSLSWRPIRGWLLQDVWDAIAELGVPAHEAYRLFGSSRVSCRFCILAGEADLAASLGDPRALGIYREMCDLELESGFAFQGSRWLSSLGVGHLADGEARLAAARCLALRRQEAQAWVPKHLQFSRGWPHCAPDDGEARRLADMRAAVGDLYGWAVRYTGWRELRDRYRELLEKKHQRQTP